ncbi:MAG: preprotein translocase subunit YajC [Actinomycetota bacterium]|nr:preprotein translocase subunit YajC [Actinomycetota bacterium]
MDTGQYASVIWLVLLLAIFYFLLIRPQQQRARRHQKLISELRVGDKVVTIGGIHGVIKSLTENTVSLKIAENIKITVDRKAIGRRREQP